ncbi:Sodium-dependent phosphate transporter 1, partial [Taenia solium]
LAFVAAFGMGEYDIVNSFGTSVGSRAIFLRTACILATICELARSVPLGARVSNTIKKDVVDLDQFDTARAARETSDATFLSLRHYRRYQHICFGIHLFLWSIIVQPAPVQPKRIKAHTASSRNSPPEDVTNNNESLWRRFPKTLKRVCGGKLYSYAKYGFTHNADSGNRLLFLFTHWPGIDTFEVTTRIGRCNV